jgi:hypothetical protein
MIAIVFGSSAARRRTTLGVSAVIGVARNLSSATIAVARGCRSQAAACRRIERADRY